MDRITLRKFAAMLLTIIMVLNLIPTMAFASTSATPVNMTNGAADVHHKNNGLVPLSNGGYASLILKSISGAALNGDEVLEGEVYVYNSGKTLAKQVTLFTAEESKVIIGASIAQLKNGGFVVVWTESDKDFTAETNRAFYQVYDNDGNEVGTTTQISNEQTYKYGNYTGIDVTGRSNGGFAVVFTTPYPSSLDSTDKLRLVIYSHNGSSYVRDNEQSTAIGHDVSTNTKEDTGLQMYPGYSQPKVVELSDGSFIVGEDMTIYKPGEQYSPFGTFMFKFDSSGNPINFADNSPNLRVNWNGYTPDSLRGFDLVALSGGGFAIASVNTLVREGATPTIQEGDLQTVAEVSIFNNDGTAKTPQVTQKVIKNGSFFDGTYYGKFITSDLFYDNTWDTTNLIDLAEIDGKLSFVATNTSNTFTQYTISKTDGTLESTTPMTISKTETMLGSPQHIKLSTGEIMYTYEDMNYDTSTSTLASNVFSTALPGAAPTTSAPTVTTTSPATSITSTGATVGGNVTADGGASITQRGVVYGTSANPTTSDSKVTATGDTGTFTVSLTGLTANTTYHYRAYATNAQGTSYGDDATFTTDSAGPVVSLTSTEINSAVNHIKNTNAGLINLTNNGHVSLVLEQIGGDNAYYTHVTEGVISVYDSSNQLVQKTPLFEADETKTVGSASIAPLKNGGFVVAYTTTNASFSPSYAYYQIYDNEGDKVGSPVKISEREDADGMNPDTINVIGRQNGGFAVVFGTTSSQDILATYSYNAGTFSKVNETVIGENTTVDIPERSGVKIYVANSKPQVIELSDGSLIVEDSMYVDYLNQVQPLGDFVLKFDSDGLPTNFADGYPMKRLNFMHHGDIHKGFDLVALSSGGFATVHSNKYDSVAGAARWDLSIFENDGTPRITNVLKQKAPLTSNEHRDEREYYGVTLAGVENPDNIALGHSSMKVNVQEIDGKISVLVGNDDGEFDILTVSPTDGSIIDSASNVGISKNNAQNVLIHPFRIQLPNNQWVYTYEEYNEERDGDNTTGYMTSNNYFANIAYKNSITFNFESRVTDLGTKKVVSQYLLGKTLIAQSDTDNLINGKESASVGVDDYSLSTGATEKTITFTVLGNRFDVLSMLLADGDTTSTEDETITITSSKGTITKTITNGSNVTFDSTTDDLNNYLKGISSFTITASDNVLNNLVMDEITLDNFVSVAATQIVSEDVPTSNTGSFTKKISDYDFTFTPATNGQPYWQTDIAGFNGIYMLNCDVLTGNDCATEFTITPPTGYSFDLSAFDYISDRNSDGTVELTVTLTHADDLTSEKTYVLNRNSVKYTFTELSDAPNDVKSIKFFTNRLVYFNNFVIDDIKPLPVSEAPTYTVTYDANGSTTGSVPTDSTKYKENEEVTISGEGDLVKTGYTFDGWNTKADGTGDAYAADDKLTIGTENVTLYAQWKSTKSAVATLTALQLVDKVDTTTIAFNETFAKDTMTYTASKITKGNDVTVNYTKEDPNAIVTYKLNGVVAGAADMTLKPGKNNIEVIVTAEDGTTTKTYKMTVTMGLKGDADVDGDVDINDWQTTANFILNREIPSAQAKWNADMNDSTTINISDWIRIAKKIVVID